MALISSGDSPFACTQFRLLPAKFHPNHCMIIHKLGNGTHLLWRFTFCLYPTQAALRQISSDSLLDYTQARTWHPSPLEIHLLPVPHSGCSLPNLIRFLACLYTSSDVAPISSRDSPLAYSILGLFSPLLRQLHALAATLFGCSLVSTEPQSWIILIIMPLQKNCTNNTIPT